MGMVSSPEIALSWPDKGIRDETPPGLNLRHVSHDRRAPAVRVDYVTDQANCGKTTCRLSGEAILGGQYEIVFPGDINYSIGHFGVFN